MVVGGPMPLAFICLILAGSMLAFRPLWTPRSFALAIPSSWRSRRKMVSIPRMRPACRGSPCQPPWRWKMETAGWVTDHTINPKSDETIFLGSAKSPRNEPVLLSPLIKQRGLIMYRAETGGLP